MNRMIGALLVICMIFTTTACGVQEPAPALKIGTYTGSSTINREDYNKTWQIIIEFREDGTFTIVNENDEEKGAGTYAETDDSYAMTYSDGRTASFTVGEDNTLNMTTDLPYGKSAIILEMVGGITLISADAATGATSR